MSPWCFWRFCSWDGYFFDGSSVSDLWSPFKKCVFVCFFLKLDQQNRSVTPHKKWVHPPKKMDLEKKTHVTPKKMEWPVPSSQTDRGRCLNPPQKKVKHQKRIQPAHVFFRLKVSPLQSWLQLSLLSVFWSPFRRFRVGMADGIPTGLLCNVRDIRVHDRFFFKWEASKVPEFLDVTKKSASL